MTALRTCDAGCGQPIEPAGTAVLLIEDPGTEEEYRGFMHSDCHDERVSIINEIKELLRL